MDVAEAGRVVILSDKSSETPSIAPEPEPGEAKEPSGLGAYLISARERRGVSRADAISESRVPEHYVRMMESNDYSMISDQLYVMPFLRRYALFLGLDPDEAVMRFVGAVQRADNAPSPRGLKPIEMKTRKRRNWTGVALVAGLLAVMVFAWLAEARHHRIAGGPSSNPAATARTTSG